MSVSDEYLRKLADALRRRGSEALPRGITAMGLAELVDDLREAREENGMWRSLWCDKPEDRLWHDADRTWWGRAFDGDGRPLKNGRAYSPFGRDPPRAIAELYAAVRALLDKEFATHLSRRRTVVRRVICALRELREWGE